jgi:hypothetical protein
MEKIVNKTSSSGLGLESGRDPASEFQVCQEQARILEHMLGYDGVELSQRSNPPWRNFYDAAPGHHANGSLAALEVMGLIELRDGLSSHKYRATQAGVAAMLSHDARYLKPASVISREAKERSLEELGEDLKRMGYDLDELDRDNPYTNHERNC